MLHLKSLDLSYNKVDSKEGFLTCSILLTFLVPDIQFFAERFKLSPGLAKP